MFLSLAEKGILRFHHFDRFIYLFIYLYKSEEMQQAWKSAASIETISLGLTNFTNVSLWYCIILAIWSFLVNSVPHGVILLFLLEINALNQVL